MPTNYNTLPYQQPQMSNENGGGWQWGGDTNRPTNGGGQFNPGALSGWGNYDWSSILGAFGNAFGNMGQQANDPNMAPNPVSTNPAYRPGTPAPTQPTGNPLSRQPGPTAINPGMPQQPQTNPTQPASPFGPFPGVNYSAPQGYNVQSNPFQPKPYNWNSY